MKRTNNTYVRISTLFWGISILVWVLLLFNPGHLMSVAHCHVSDAGPSAASWEMLLAMNPVSVLLSGWTLMVLAMMLPKLTGPVTFIIGRSLKQKRLQAALLFVFGYVAMWVSVGLLMIALILSLNLLMPGSYLPAITIGITAVIWQCSPIKQRCLNRGHNHRTLAAFGWKADRDAIVFGLEHGLWCVGSGWALMLFPMLLPVGHNMAMLAATVLMISEHLEHPQVPRWRFNFSSKLLRGLYAQTRIRLDRGLSLT